MTAFAPDSSLMWGTSRDGPSIYLYLLLEFTALVGVSAWVGRMWTVLGAAAWLVHGAMFAHYDVASCTASLEGLEIIPGAITLVLMTFDIVGLLAFLWVVYSWVWGVGDFANTPWVRLDGRRPLPSRRWGRCLADAHSCHFTRHPCCRTLCVALNYEESSSGSADDSWPTSRAAHKMTSLSLSMAKSTSVLNPLTAVDTRDAVAINSDKADALSTEHEPSRLDESPRDCVVTPSELTSRPPRPSDSPTGLSTEGDEPSSGPYPPLPAPWSRGASRLQSIPVRLWFAVLMTLTVVLSAAGALIYVTILVFNAAAYLRQVSGQLQRRAATMSDDEQSSEATFAAAIAELGAEAVDAAGIALACAAAVLATAAVGTAVFHLARYRAVTRALVARGYCSESHRTALRAHGLSPPSRPSPTMLELLRPRVGQACAAAAAFCIDPLVALGADRSREHSRTATSLPFTTSASVELADGPRSRRRRDEPETAGTALEEHILEAKSLGFLFDEDLSVFPWENVMRFAGVMVSSTLAGSVLLAALIAILVFLVAFSVTRQWVAGIAVTQVVAYVFALIERCCLRACLTTPQGIKRRRCFLCLDCCYGLSAGVVIGVMSGITRILTIAAINAVVSLRLDAPLIPKPFHLIDSGFSSWGAMLRTRADAEAFEWDRDERDERACCCPNINESGHPAARTVDTPPGSVSATVSQPSTPRDTSKWIEAMKRRLAE